jgi:hypothetical protein
LEFIATADTAAALLQGNDPDLELNAESKDGRNAMIASSRHNLSVLADEFADHKLAIVDVLQRKLSAISSVADFDAAGLPLAHYIAVMGAPPWLITLPSSAESVPSHGPVSAKPNPGISTSELVSWLHRPPSGCNSVMDQLMWLQQRSTATVSMS